MITQLKELIKTKNSRQLIQFIKNHPEVLDQKDENGSSGFFLITYSGDAAAFEKAKAVKPSFDFYEAIVSGRLDQVKKELDDDDQKMNRHSNDGFTPLALATFFYQTDIAKFLLSKGADPNLGASNPSRVNALHSAVARENEELVRLFLEKGADPNITQAQNVTPLHSAVHRGNFSMVQTLLDHEADTSVKMDNGDDALSIAEKEGHSEIAAMLKSHK